MTERKNLKLVAAYMDDKQAEALRKLAESNHRSLSGELRLAVETHLKAAA